jgi:hypothetical protein
LRADNSSGGISIHVGLVICAFISPGQKMYICCKEHGVIVLPLFFSVIQKFAPAGQFFF